MYVVKIQNLCYLTIYKQEKWVSKMNDKPYTCNFPFKTTLDQEAMILDNLEGGLLAHPDYQ